MNLVEAINEVIIIGHQIRQLLKGRAFDLISEQREGKALKEVSHGFLGNKGYDDNNTQLIITLLQNYNPLRYNR